RRHHGLQQVHVAGIEDQRGGLQDRQRVEAHAHVAGRACAAEDRDRQSARRGRAADLVGHRHRQHREQHRLRRECPLADRPRRNPDDRLSLPQYLCCHMSSTRRAPRYRSASLCDSTRPKRTIPLTRKKSEPTDSRFGGSAGDPSKRDRATSRLAKKVRCRTPSTKRRAACRSLSTMLAARTSGGAVLTLTLVFSVANSAAPARTRFGRKITNGSSAVMVVSSNPATVRRSASLSSGSAEACARLPSTIGG